jgi:hypothetical protein
MVQRFFCSTPKCGALLGVADSTQLRFKNKSERTVVEGRALVVRKTCRRCGEWNELRLPVRP